MTDNAGANAQVETSSERSSLVIVYHRQPYEEVEENGRTIYRENKSPNGIVPTLKSFFGTVNRGAWVAWKQVSTDADREKFERRVTISDTYGTYNVSRLPLHPDQVKSFYAVTSKEALWPILHSFKSHFNYDAADWETYREVNWLFAEAACQEAADDALIWVHDYNLWLVPMYIRQMKPDARIAFFHHTPFPSADLFNILPWRAEIVESLLQCDLIGFHIPRYAENFVGTARSMFDIDVREKVRVETSQGLAGHALSEPFVTTELGHRDQAVTLDSWPVGANPDYIQSLLAKPEAEKRVQAIRDEIKGQRLICSVGRVDYTKGTIAMLEAYERLLVRRPELRGHVKLMVTAVTANQDMRVYREEQQAIEQLVGQIHGRYATLSWGPIMLFTTPIPFEELVCYYKVAEVCWTTPLRDGLNLVAKEFVATHKDDAGALVLSEFTGAAIELDGAILTNPYSARNMDRTIDQALDMPEEEQRGRMARMAQIVERYNIEHWARHVMERFDAVRARRDAGKKAAE